MRRIDVAYMLITNEDKDQILMVENIDTAIWSLPGGTVEAGESLDTAAIREAKEETGLDVELLGICAINECVFEGKGEHAVFFTFRAKIVAGTFNITRPDEIGSIEWAEIDKAERLMPYYKGGLKKILEAEVIPYHNQGVWP